MTSDERELRDLLKPLADREDDRRFRFLRRDVPDAVLLMTDIKPKYDLDVGLGAILRTAAACGWEVCAAVLETVDTEISHFMPDDLEKARPELHAARRLVLEVERRGG